MPNPNEIVVNGVVVPLNENAIVEKGIDKSASFSDSLWSSGGKSTDEILMESQKLKQDIELAHAEKEYDGIWATASKFSDGVFNGVYAALEDTIGAFDIGDWRVDTATNEMKGADYLFKLIDNTIGDGENETGNYFTRRAAEVRAHNAKYSGINTQFETLNYVLNNTRNLVGSAAGFVLSGAGIGKAVTWAAGANKWINTITTASLMTQAGSVGIAQGVYDKVYEEKLSLSNPNLRQQKQEAGEKAYQEYLSQNPEDIQNAELQREQAEKQTIEQYAKDNPEAHAKAQKSAAVGADTAMKANASSFFLNILSSGLFFKGSVPSSNILAKPQAWGSKKAWLAEGLQESVEEGITENLAEKSGLAAGMGKNYGLSDAMADIFSLETLESAVWGFIGGAGQTALTERLTHKDRVQQYDEQQKVINKQNEIGKAVGQPEILNNLVSFSTSIKDLSELAKKQQELYDAGLTEEANAVGDKIMHNQALHAFKTGTTENLIANYRQVASDSNTIPEVKEAALKAVKDIQHLEKVYNNSSQYLNSESVYRNRANDFLLNKLKDEFQAKVTETKLRAGEGINALLESGETSLKAAIKTQGEKVGDVTISEGNLPFSLDTIFENNFEDAKHKEIYGNFLNYISNDTTGLESVRQLRELNARQQVIQDEIKKNNQNYNKFVSNSYQKSLVVETQLAKSFEEMKPLLVQEAGSDKYEQIVDNVLSKYKGRLTDTKLQGFKKRFMELNEVKKDEIQQQEETAILKEAAKANPVTETTRKVDDASKPVSPQRQAAANTIYSTGSNVTKKNTPKTGMTEYYGDFLADIEGEHIEQQLSSKGYFAISKDAFDKLQPDEQKYIKKQIKNVANKGWEFLEDERGIAVYDDRKINPTLNPTQTDDSGIEILEPLELNDNISAEAQKQIKEQVADFYESLKSDLGYEPSFEEFVRDYMKHSSRNDADKYFNVLVKGWEANGYKKEDFNQVYNTIFRNRKEIANTLSALAEQVVGKVVVDTKEELVKEVKETTTAIEQKQTNAPTFTATGQVYEYRGFTTHEKRSKLAYVTRLNKTVVEKTEEGIAIEHEYTEDELNSGEYVNSLPLLNPDRYLVGTILQVAIPVNKDEMLIVPIYNEDGTKQKAIPFGKWVNQKMEALNMSREQFEQTQEYKDKVPMVVVDDIDGSVALIHDIGWYRPAKFMETEAGQMEEAIANTRVVRQEVLKGNSEIVITEKRGGTYEPFQIPEDKPTITIREANPQAVIAVADKNGNLVTVEKDGSINALKENQSFENTKEFAIGKTYDIRKTGKDTFTAFPVFQRGLNEQVQESILEAVKLYINKYNKNLTADEKAKNDRTILAFKNQTGYDLSSAKDLDAYIKNFVKLETVSASTYDELHKKITVNDRMPAGSPYLLTQKGAVVFGLKGEKLGKEEYMSIHPEKMKEDNAAPLAEYIFSTFADKVLPKFMQNVNIASLLLGNKPLMLLDKDGNIKTTASNYHEYLMDNLETNMRSANIGTKDNPLYVTKAQPIITFDLTNNPNRKVLEVQVPTSKVKETPTKSLVEKQVINTAPQQQLEQAVTKAEQEKKFEFIGETPADKVEDLKTWVNKEEPKSEDLKEFVETYVNPVEEVKAELVKVEQPIVDKFVKKNIFTVKPIQSADKKAVTKASIATKYVGYGEGITGSSTETYRKQAGEFANVGTYDSNDVVFVSIGGKRGNDTLRKEQQDRTITEALLAISSGATLITDNKAYTDASTYNEGEKRLAERLLSEGYIYSEITVDKQLLGVWSKEQVTAKPEIKTVAPVKSQEQTIEQAAEDFQDFNGSLLGNGWTWGVYTNGKVFINSPTDIELNSEEVKNTKEYLANDPRAIALYNEMIRSQASFNEFVKQYSKEDVTTLDEKVANLVKQAEQDLKWINDESDFYDPFELTDAQVKEAITEIDRINGIDPQHQYQLVDYIYNRISSEVGIDYGSKVDSESISKQIRDEITLLTTQSKESYNTKLETLKTVYSQYPDRYPQLASIIAKYDKAISKIDIINNSVDILEREAKKKLAKFTGISETKENEDTTEEVDENNEVEKNFSKTSLEENGKLTSSYRLKRFFSGIADLDKNGNPVTALLGVPTYVGFDSVFEVCQATLADVPADFNLMIEKLEQNRSSHGWLGSVIDKLKTADKIIQNEFVSTMTKHSLNMEFLMYSFDRKTGGYTLKVFNTNGSAITRIIANNWNNNLKQSPLVKVTQGNYEIDKVVAQRLLAEFNSWASKPEKLSGKSVIDVSKYIGKGEFTLAKPLSDFNRGSKFTFYSKGNYIINAVQGKPNTYIINEYKPSLVSELVERGSKATPKAKQEGIQVLSEWLSNFGINLSQGTWENLIENGMYHTYNGTRSSFPKLFTTSIGNATSGFFGILAGKLKHYTIVDNLNLDENNNHPLGDSAIEKDLVKLESRFTSNIVPNVFRDGGKAIYGFTPSKFITDRTQALRESNSELVSQLQSLSFSSESLWLKLLKEEQGFNEKFDISHLGLNAIKELGKKLYRDNDIVNLADADHELVKLGMFQADSGGVYAKINKGQANQIDLRMSRLFSPTMSDKTTMTIIKGAVLDLQHKHFTIDNKGEVTANDEILNVLLEQLVAPELKRITNFHSKIKKTNIKSYDDGAKIFLMLPSLNLLKTKDGNSLIKAMELAPEVWNFEKVLADHREDFKKELNTYLERLLSRKIEVWTNNGYISKTEEGISLKYMDAKYLEKFSQEENTEVKAKLAAMDYIINQLIANSNSFMSFIGDPAIYYKANPKNDFVKQSKDTFTNVGKRLAAQIAPGNKIADSANNKYLQVFLNDNKTVSENIEYLTELLDNKKFDKTEWNRIQSITDKKEKRDATDTFLESYPNSAEYFAIESTDGQEYTTWKEHLYILEKMGRTPDVAIDITPEEIREAREMFANNIPMDSFTEKQKAVYKKVMQPIKPVYTGQVYDPQQDVMRVIYIKTSSFPLLPQVTSGLELDKLRVAMEALETKSNKSVRASYQTGVKVGGLPNPYSVFKQQGGFKDISVEDLENSSLVLDRNNFRIQQDVPFKSAKRNEDTVTLGTQTLKLLFGSGITEINGFKYNGSEKTGKELLDIYNSNFMELIKFKRDEFFEEIGVDINGNPKNLEYTVKKLQSVLKEEAEGRGYPKQDIEALGIEHKVDSNGKVIDVKFTLPLWLAANSNRYEALLNAIVTNRVAKVKMPGNSYPLGSEEGFEFRTDLKGIDKSKVVFTSKWNGKLQAAKVDKNGNFISAQVLVPSKFRDKNGNLIDLFAKKDGEYLYVTQTPNGVRLKEDMFDADLMSINSFRIPTSGLVSMCQLEIVGFLPYEVGDLMILPKNFTKQKGIDFDIDKESTYQYWHLQDDNGKFHRVDKKYSLKEVEARIIAEPNNSLWRKLKVKLIQNNIVEVHKAIMTNPSKDVQSKINGILSIDFAKEQADKIDGWIQGTKDDSYFTPLDDEYQKSKMGLGAAGKIGIGAYSIDVVFNSLAQQLRKSSSQLQLMEVGTEGEVMPKSFTFDGITSNGLLGELKTLSSSGYNGDRTIAQVMAEAQNIATDNEKEQVMGRVNLNSYTLDVHKVFNLLGFDKGSDENSIPLMFLSQPILRDFTKEIANASANISEFAPDKEEKIIAKLLAKYESAGAKAPDLLSKYDNLFSNTKMAAEIQAKKADGEFQAAVLFKFLEMREYGIALRAVQGTLNVDSKGLGKSTYDAIERVAQLERLASSKVVSNATSLAGDFIEKRELSKREIENKIAEGYLELPNYLFKPTTIVGAFTGYTVNASQVWNNYLPYSSKEFAEIYDEVLTAMGKSELAGSAAIDKKQHILKEMKKYFYSNPIFFTGSPQLERSRLFFDNDNNSSLASYLQDLFTNTEIPSIKRNKLINRFQYDVNTDGNISRIIFNNSQGENFDEEYLYNAILELAEKPITLPDYNGKSYNTRKLAQDLVIYSFLEGGVQEAVQFSKYIPISLLKVSGFTKAMQEIQDKIIYNRGNVFGKDGRRDEDNPHFISRFAMQYAQHNPERFTKVDEKTITDLKGVVYSSKDKKVENIESFPTPPSVKGKPTFLTLYNSNIKLGKKFQLYYFDGFKYIRVPVLGTFGMAEYNAKDNLYPSLISVISEEVKPNVDKVKPQPQIKEQPKVERIEQEEFTLTNSLDWMIKMGNNEGFKDIAVMAKALKPFMKNTTKMAIAANLPARGKYEADTDTILIQDTWMLEASPSELARTVLKEYVHSLTANELLKYVDSKGNFKSNNVPQYITRLVRLFKEVETKLGKELQELRTKDRSQGLTSREKKVVYGGYNLLEFVEMVMTQPEFQQEMDKVPYANTNETLFERFKNIVKDILKAIGVNFDEKGITSNAISSVFELIESEQNLDKPKEFSNFDDTQIEPQIENLLKETDEMLNPNKEVIVDGYAYFKSENGSYKSQADLTTVTDALILNKIAAKEAQKNGTLKVATDEYNSKYAMLPDGRIIILTEIRTKDNVVVFEVGEEIEDPNQKIKNLFSINNKAQVSQSNILSLRNQQIDYTDDQRTALEKVANFILGNNRFFRMAGFAGTGKAQPLTSKIYTPQGFKLMGEIQIGDYVFGEDGKPKQVLGIFPQGKKDVYKVTFSDGVSVECCGEHLWKVKTYVDRNRQRAYLNKQGIVKDYFSILTTLELKENIIHTRKDGNKDLNFKLPVTKAVEFEKKSLSINPYLLGALIGDGGLANGSIRFTNVDSHILYKVKSIVDSEYSQYSLSFKQVSDTITYSISGEKGNSKNYILDNIRELGLDCKSECKFIPKQYLYSSIEDRIALLQGLMDTDGTVDKRGSSIIYNTTSEKLKNDVIELVQSLGCIASWSFKNNEFLGCYNIYINQSNEFPLFTLPRKQELVKAKTKYKTCRYITNIELVGNVEQQCIYIDSESHLYLTDNFVVTHNTTIAENIVKFAFQSRKGSEVLAPTNKAAARLREKLESTGLNIEAMTIHKAMYGEPNPITGEFEGGRLEANTVYVIDESSMITGKILDDLKAKLPPNSKIIFVGDGFQLEPVVGKGDYDPKLFENNDLFGDDYTQLSEVKRQEGDILAVATTMRITQEANIPNSSTDDFIIEKNKASIVEAFKEAIRNNEDAVFIVPVNKERIENNKLARQVKFGNTTNVVEAGESLIGISNSLNLANSEIITVERVLNQTTVMPVEINLGSIDSPNITKVNFALVEIQATVGKLKRTFQVLLSPDTDKPSIYGAQLAQAVKEKRPGTSLFSHLVSINNKGKFVLDNNVAVATYGYSITAHKSQGSEWNKVFVSPSWLADSWNHARWIYTAITRAKKTVHFLPSKYTKSMRMATIEAIAKNKDYNSKPTQEDLDNSVLLETFDPLEIVNNLKSQGKITEYCK